MIELINVTKTYRSLFGKSVRALDDMTLQSTEGEVLGIAGPNGAGKSTLISLLLGYLNPSSGRVMVSGMEPRKYAETHGVGYLSELVALPPRWTVKTALQRFATLSGVPNAGINARVDEVIDQLGIGEHRDKYVKALSKGNLQRLGLAQAILRDDRLLILDEPTHGLDPVWTANFRDIVRGLRKPWRTILIASHNLDELERLADRVAIIDHGRLQRLVSTRYVPEEAASNKYRLQITAGEEHVPEAFGNPAQVGKGEYEVDVSGLHDLNKRLADFIGRGGLIASVSPSRSVLETHFREAVEVAK